MPALGPRRSARHPPAWRRLLLGALVCSTILGLLAEASAAPLALQKVYEAGLIRWGLQRAGLERDPDPAGKTIARIVIVREDIIAESDPWPRLINIVHVKTREYVVARELLVRAGQRYDPELVSESERNLRKLFILAVARIVPCKARRPGEVVLLVVTKDLWSIRLGLVWDQTGAVLKSFQFAPTESNFLGRRKSLTLSLRLQQFDFGGPTLRDHIGFGASYLDHRLFGTRLRLLASAAFDVDGHVPCGGNVGEATQGRAWCSPHDAGHLSGYYARVYVDRPLFSLATKWGFVIDSYIDRGQQRVFSVADGRAVLATRKHAPDGDPLTARHVPWVYQRTLAVSQMLFTRSFGRALKHDFSWGLLTYHLRYEPPEGFPFAEETRRWFVDSVLPRSESAAAYVLRYELRPTRFARLREINTFALSEDISLGPRGVVELRLAQNLVHPDQPFVELLVTAGYNLGFAGDILRVAATGVSRHQLGPAGADGVEGPWINNRLSLTLHNISPPLWIGRLHIYGTLTLRARDVDRNSVQLDSDVVRGYQASNIFGRNAFRATAEYRTRPLNLWTLHVGGVLFYDAGSVWGENGPGQDPDDYRFVYRHSVGLGLRAVFPQFDKETFRVDLGFPLQRDGRGGFGTWFSLSFGQSFGDSSAATLPGRLQ